MTDTEGRTIDRLIDALDGVHHAYAGALDCPSKLAASRPYLNAATVLAMDIRTQLEARALDDAALATYTEVTP